MAAFVKSRSINKLGKSLLFLGGGINLYLRFSEEIQKLKKGVK